MCSGVLSRLLRMFEGFNEQVVAYATRIHPFISFGSIANPTNQIPNPAVGFSQGDSREKEERSRDRVGVLACDSLACQLETGHYSKWHVSVFLYGMLSRMQSTSYTSSPSPSTDVDGPGAGRLPGGPRPSRRSSSACE